MDFAVFLLMAFPRYKIFRMLFFKISTSNISSCSCGRFHETVCSQFVEQCKVLQHVDRQPSRDGRLRLFSFCSFIVCEQPISLCFIFQSLILLILKNICLFTIYYVRFSVNNRSVKSFIQ